MSNIVDALLDNAFKDYQLIEENEAKGDKLSTSRVIQFLLYAKDATNAELVANFINDNCYGGATYTENNLNHRIEVKIDMPPTHNILNSISGLMACIAEIYDLEYDGWCCELQR